MCCLLMIFTYLCESAESSSFATEEAVAVTEAIAQPANGIKSYFYLLRM